MTSYNNGDIVLVPFPFTNQKTGKKRPAVIISSPQYNIERPDLIIMAVTSRIKTRSVLGETLIQDWQPAGLLKPSVIKPVITTIEKNLSSRSWGNCHKKTGPI